MKMRIMAVAAIVFAQIATGEAGTFPASISREPLAVGRVSERLSIGVGYDSIKRGLDIKNGPAGLGALLEADSLSGYAGFDVLPWLTSFVTVGSVELKSGAGIKTDAKLKISGGVSAYLWEADVLSPGFMAGRVSVKADAELARFESGVENVSVEWFEALAALPIGYELFDRYPSGSSGVATSLALYAGPAISYLSGTAKTSYGDVDFDGDQQFGMVAGADVYFAPQISIGAKLTIFDELSYGATLRFHF